MNYFVNFEPLCCFVVVCFKG